MLHCLTNNTYTDVSSNRTCVTACNPAGLTPWADNNTWSCVDSNYYIIKIATELGFRVLSPIIQPSAAYTTVLPTATPIESPPITPPAGSNASAIPTPTTALALACAPGGARSTRLVLATPPEDSIYVFPSARRRFLEIRQVFGFACRSVRRVTSPKMTQLGSVLLAVMLAHTALAFPALWIPKTAQRVSSPTMPLIFATCAAPLWEVGAILFRSAVSPFVL